ITDAGLDHLETLPELTELSFSGCRRLTDDGLRRLAPLTQLVRLVIAYAPFSDAGLDALAGMEKLEILGLQGTRVKGAGLRHFKGLKDLSLGLAEVTDSGLSSIAGMSELHSLGLYSTQISAAGLAHLSGLRNLETLTLFECPNVDDACLAQLKGLK